MGSVVFWWLTEGDVTAIVMLLISEGEKPQGISTPSPPISTHRVVQITRNPLKIQRPKLCHRSAAVIN